MKTREQKIELLSKLMDKARSTKDLGNLEEAEAFMAKAVQLMNEWAIEEYEVYRTHNTKLIIVEKTVQCKFDYYGAWEGSLACSLGKYFFVQASWRRRVSGYRSPYGKQYSFKHSAGSVTFTGAASNIDAIEYVFDFYRNVVNEVAWKEWTKAKKEKSRLYRIARNLPLDTKVTEGQLASVGLPNVRKFILSFCKGATTGILLKLREQETLSTGKEIVVRHDEEIDQYKASKGIREVTVEDVFQADEEVLVKGIKVGRSLSAIKVSNSKKLLSLEGAPVMGVALFYIPIKII
ncbi:MAG: DUF2786 domain-containing protein [Acinetobacter sp.]|nr:DUF2786 domain-containing protein [Acinetobacter sp.]